MSELLKTSTKGHIIVAVMRLIALLPIAWARVLLRPIAWLQRVVPNNTKNVIDINLATCLPELSTHERRSIRNANITYNIDLLTEIVHIWFHDYAHTKRMLSDVHGLDAFKHELDSDGGTLVISPHFGNWELVWSYLCNEYQCAGLYRPPRIKELEAVRLQGSNQGEVVRTRAIDVRKMLKILKQDRALFLLPDQQPPEGSGKFAPFFGHPAYTMTLLHGLANRTGSSVWMATCLKGQQGYELSFTALELHGELDIDQFNRQLNRLMAEHIIKVPEQYQWSYKRFKKTADGSANIYNLPSVKT